MEVFVVILGENKTVKITFCKHYVEILYVIFV